MAQVYQCDRCKGVIAELWECTEVRGYDLCASCVKRLDAWIASGTLKVHPLEGKSKAPKNTDEASMAVVRVIVEREGKVSAKALADATGESYRSAYLRLRHLFRKSHLERVSGCAYRLPAPESQAAE